MQSTTHADTSQFKDQYLSPREEEHEKGKEAYSSNERPERIDQEIVTRCDTSTVTEHVSYRFISYIEIIPLETCIFPNIA